MDAFIAMGFDVAAVQNAFDTALGNSEIAMEILLGVAPSEFNNLVGQTTIDDKNIIGWSFLT